MVGTARIPETNEIEHHFVGRQLPVAINAPSSGMLNSHQITAGYEMQQKEGRAANSYTN
jgi:hypothetical protein